MSKFQVSSSFVSYTRTHDISLLTIEQGDYCCGKISVVIGSFVIIKEVIKPLNFCCRFNSLI